jgi:hypothetical protein
MIVCLQQAADYDPMLKVVVAEAASYQEAKGLAQDLVDSTTVIEIYDGPCSCGPLLGHKVVRAARKAPEFLGRTVPNLSRRI